MKIEKAIPILLVMLTFEIECPRRNELRDYEDIDNRGWKPLQQEKRRGTETPPYNAGGVENH